MVSDPLSSIILKPASPLVLTPNLTAGWPFGREHSKLANENRRLIIHLKKFFFSNDLHRFHELHKKLKILCSYRDILLIFFVVVLPNSSVPFLFFILSFNLLF